MEKLVLRMIVFLFIIFIYLLANYILNSYFIKSNPYKIAKDKNTLILGDSHLMSACDPEIIENSINVCLESEPYFVSFYKLKEIYKNNSQLDTIILGLGWHNISEFNDTKLLKKPFCKKFMASSYPLFSRENLKGIPNNKEEYILSLIKNMMLFPKRKHHSFIGRFKKSTITLIGNKDVRGPIKRHFYMNGKDAKISVENQIYLDSIVDFTQKNNLYLYLVNTPLHEDYKKFVKEQYKKVYKDKITEYGNLNQTYIMDYSDKILADSLYRNHDHLNSSGAKVISEDIVLKMKELSRK